MKKKKDISKLKSHEKKKVLEKELSRINKKYGQLRASDIVKESENKNNIIYYFISHDVDQNDYKYRLIQARELIKSIKIEVSAKINSRDIIVNYRKWITNRGFKNYTPGEKEWGYTETNVVLQKPDLRNNLMKTIAEELMVLYHRGYILSELKNEMSSIKLVADTIFEKVENQLQKV